MILQFFNFPSRGPPLSATSTERRFSFLILWSRVVKFFDLWVTDNPFAVAHEFPRPRLAFMRARMIWLRPSINTKTLPQGNSVSSLLSDAPISWSGIFSSPSLVKFHDPDSAVFAAAKTCLRLPPNAKNLAQARSF